MSSPDATYWDIVRSQFGKHRTAVWGLRIVAFLFVIAITAPVFATSSPFAIRKADGDWEHPWFLDLLDQNVFLSGVDLFFNLLLVFTPFAILAWWLLARWRRRVFAVLPILFLWSFVSMVLPDGIVETSAGRVLFAPQAVFRVQRPKVNYLRERAGELNRILAEQRVALFEKKVVGTADSLAGTVAALEAKTLGAVEKRNLEVERVAHQEEHDKAKRQLKAWRAKKEAADAHLADPKNEVTVIVPPVGFHHDDNDEERVTERPTFSGWGTGHFLGTDSNGRDVLARILYGTRVSLTVGVIAVSIYCTIGTILGSLMGFFGGWVDIFLMRFVEIMICFPALAFILILVAVFQTKSIFLIMVGIALVSWTGVARLIRGQFLQERSQDYVVAAQALGIPTRKIVFKHVLPNAIHPMFVAATFGVASAILVEAGLAFLGLGDPNVPSWGQLLLEGRTEGKLWLILSPGVAIFLTVTVLNLVGEGLRDALDPKLRQ